MSHPEQSKNMARSKNSKATRNRVALHRAGSVAHEKFTIIARYGRTQRGCSTSDLRGVWAAAEYELCHGADDVTIIVNRDRPPNGTR